MLPFLYDRKYSIAFLLCCLAGSVVFGQEDESVKIPSDDPLVKLANRYKPRPKFAEFNVELFQPFGVEADAVTSGQERATVRENLIREVKLKFPVLLKDSFNIIGGLGYRHEQFKFEDQTDPDFPFFSQFEDKSLKRISFQLYFKRDLKKERFLYVFFRSSLNSDVPSFENFENQLKVSITTVFGRNKSLHKALGYGISFGYDFGQPAIFPLFIYTNDFTQHWGLELMLPKKAQLRYSPNQSNHFYTAVDLQGASYHLRDSVL
ncbi:MAG: DUF6268 family outer membrane beta-barrel protein, partial [Fulvivirga sp.]|nr:DUF6268 family outer membrane beta-barrel protein [Fulvivirga sp.]